MRLLFCRDTAGMPPSLNAFDVCVCDFSKDVCSPDHAVVLADHLLSLEDKRWNDAAMNWARTWFQDIPELHYCGMNTGELFYGEFAYLFISAIKTALTAHAAIQKFKPASIRILDDGSYWPAMLADYLHSQQVVFERESIGEARKPAQPRITFKILAKELRSLLMRQSIRPGAILASCAPKFAEPFWKNFPGRSHAYLRREFSFEVHRFARKNSIDEVYFSGHLQVREMRGVNKEMNGGAALKAVEKHFSESDFFLAGNIDLWPVLKPRMLTALKARLAQYACYVRFFSAWLKKNKPSLILVEEDTTPFNMALVRSAALAGIPSVQVQHGVLAHALFLPVRSTKIAAMGESARKRLINWGVPESQIEVIGSLHLPKSQDRESHAGGKPYFILATHPFQSGQKSDWIGSADTPQALVQMLETAAQALKAADSNLEMVVKLHPRDPHRSFTEARLSELGILSRCRIEQKMPSLELLAEAQFLICGNSTVFCEALLTGCPVWLLDHGSRRCTDFLSSRFIDLEKKEQAVETLARILTSPAVRRDRLAEQRAETESHFRDGNHTVVENWRGLLEAMAGPVKELV